MKKGMGTWLIVGGAVLVIGALGFILLRKPKDDKKSDASNDPMSPPNPNTSGGGVIDAPKPEVSGPSFELMGFVQKKNTPNVNILSGPTLFSGTAKKVESFTTIYARPSKSGWFEVSEDGTTTLGYVPNGTLRKL
jgi:hypothetical protein